MLRSEETARNSVTSLKWTGQLTTEWQKCSGGFRPCTVHGRVIVLIEIMAIADIDGDGKLDIVVRSLQANQIHIFFQDSIVSCSCVSLPGPDTEIGRVETPEVVVETSCAP